MRADWSVYTATQIACVEALEFAPPLHETMLKRRHGVHGSTITSCIRLGLVRRVYLSEPGCSYGMPFLTLTQLGEAVKSDWLRWRSSAAAKIGAAFPGADALRTERLLSGRPA